MISPKITAHVVFEEWVETRNGWLWALIQRLVRLHVFVILDWVEQQNWKSDDSLVIIDPASKGTSVLPRSRKFCNKVMRGRNIYRVITLQIPHRPTQKYKWLELHTCVTVVKRVLGINKWSIWTPRQLLRYLDG